LRSIAIRENDDKTLGVTKKRDRKGRKFYVELAHVGHFSLSYVPVHFYAINSIVKNQGIVGS